MELLYRRQNRVRIHAKDIELDGSGTTAAVGSRRYAAPYAGGAQYPAQSSFAPPVLAPTVVSRVEAPVATARAGGRQSTCEGRV